MKSSDKRLRLTAEEKKERKKKSNAPYYAKLKEKIEKAEQIEKPVEPEPVDEKPKPKPKPKPKTEAPKI